MSEALRITDPATKQSQGWLGVAVRFTALNLLAAIACTTLTLIFLLMTYVAAAASYKEPLPFAYLYLVPLSIGVIAVAAVGASVGRFTKHLPWLGAVLTPLSVIAVFRLLGARDIPSSNVIMACIPAGILVAGAAGGRLVQQRFKAGSGHANQ